MKKNLFAGMAALMLCGVFTSCSHDTDFAGNAVEQSIQQNYEQAFKARFGTPDPNQEWGFGVSSSRARTRASQSAPAPTYLAPTFNAQLAEAATKTGIAWNQGIDYGKIEFMAPYRSWDGSGWNDAFYLIESKPVASTYSEDYLAQIRNILLAEIPERENNLSKAVAPGYSITTTGGPVTLTPIYHNSSSADMISYYYYKVGTNPSVDEIKAMKKYTIGYMADPEVCKGTTDEEHYSFHHSTFSLVYVDEQGNASYEFPKGYEIHFIISNVDLAHNFDFNIFDRLDQNNVLTKTIHNYPEYYADGRLNTAIHRSGIDQWKLKEGQEETPHAAIFRIGEKSYVGFEDWIDLDFNDVIFEVTGTDGGTDIDDEDKDDWEEIRVIAEDLSVGEETDFDFNDVVFDVRRYTKTTKLHTLDQVEVILRAAGGTLPLYVDNKEVHLLFQADVDEMVNTNAKSKGLKGCDRGPVTFTLENPQGSTIGEIAKNIEVYVIKDGVKCVLSAPKGQIASKIGVKCDYVWCAERQDLDNLYSLDGQSLFKQWVQYILPDDGWYEYAKQSILKYKPAF